MSKPYGHIFGFSTRKGCKYLVDRTSIDCILSYEKNIP